jgi:uncharacterized membrane protein
MKAMTHATHIVHIERPIEEVFDFLANGANNPLWQPLVVRTVPADDARGNGSAFRQTMRHPLGFRVSADYRITESERPRWLALVVTSGGPLRPTLSYALTASGTESTDIRCTVDYRPGGLGRLALPVLSLLHPLFAWEASSVRRAKELLELTDRAA